jgi:hypothetical protein
MKRLAIPLSVLAMASLGACMTYETTRPANTFTSAPIAAQPIAYHAGSGTITHIMASPSYVTAAAGGSSGASTVRPGYPLNRLTVRMDNGALQYIDTDSNEFRSGMRVELLPDRTIRPVFPR